MNPSSVNGGLGNSGVKPGMIASSSDAPVVNIGGGAGNSRKPSKKILIAVVIVAVILVGAIVAVMMIPTGSKAPASNPTIDDNSDDSGSSDSDSNDTSDDASDDADVLNSEYKYHGENKEFYQYGNYILNGKKNVSTGLDLGNYSASSDYALKEAVKNNNLQFINQAVSLWKAFVGSMSEALANVQAQNVLMGWLEKYASINARIEDETWKLYYEMGLDSAVKMIKADYAALAGMGYEAGAKWAEKEGILKEQGLKLFSAYDALGCIKNNEFDQECINKNKTELKDLMLEYKKAKAAVEETKFSVENLAEEIIKNCFLIRNELGKGGTNE